MARKVSKSDAQLLLLEWSERLRLTSSGVVRAVDNLNEALPGFPSRASGAAPSSASVSVSPDPEGPVHLLPVERLAITPDPARSALRRIEQLVDQLGPQVTELYSLVLTWGYDRHQAQLDLDEEHEWCESCLRLQRCEPRFRGKLCRWCYTFVSEQGRRPSVELLDSHHRGVRITARMIEADHPVRKRTKTGRRTSRSAA